MIPLSFGGGFVVDSWSILFDIIVLLSSALVLGAICVRLRQSPLVGYLLAGMFLGGPGGIGAVRSEHEVEIIAELGVSLLLFSLGLEFSIRRFINLGSRSLAAGLGQIVLCALGGFFFAKLIGLESLECVIIGSVVALSSTAAVLRVFTEEGTADSVFARDALAILLVQDLAVVPLAILFSVLGEAGGVAGLLSRFGNVLLLATGLVVVLYVVLNQLAVRALHALSDRPNRELALILGVVSGLGATWAAHAAGVSPALGAFVAGMFLGGSPFATQIRGDIASLRVVLLTLFFSAAGMVADPLWILSNLVLVISFLLILIAVKTLFTVVSLRLARKSIGVAVATALSLAQIGEFAFVLGAIARARGILGEETYNAIVSCTIASLLATPYLVRLAPKAGRRLARLHVASEEDLLSMPRAASPVILVGFGPAGRLAAEAVKAANRGLTVIDLNPASIREAELRGFQGVLGDASQAEVLEEAHIDAAETVVIALPDSDASLQVAHHVREKAPHVHLIVRLRHELHRPHVQMANVDVVVGDEEEVGAGLARRVVEAV